MKRIVALFAIVISLIQISCSKPIFVEPYPGTYQKGEKPYKVFNKWYYPISYAIGYNEQGVASWYGEDFHGKTTSIGEPYDMNAMTAAHKILPLGTMVRVRNIENGKNIIVRINDRGPFIDGRVIDLSYKAACMIGMIPKGTALVKIEAISSDFVKIYKPRNQGKTENLTATEDMENSVRLVKAELISKAQLIAKPEILKTKSIPKAKSIAQPELTKAITKDKTISIPELIKAELIAAKAKAIAQPEFVKAEPIAKAKAIAKPEITKAEPEKLLPQINSVFTSSDQCLVVQVGAFRDKKNAMDAFNKIKKVYKETHIKTIQNHSNVLYKVLVGKCLPQKDIRMVEETLAENGYMEIFVTTIDKI